jgi:hypothetical protein
LPLFSFFTWYSFSFLVSSFFPYSLIFFFIILFSALPQNLLLLLSLDQGLTIAAAKCHANKQTKAVL